MQWGDIQQIGWMLILMIIITLSVHVYRWRERVKKNFADHELLGVVFPITSSKRYAFKLILGCLAIFFIILALMDPLYGEKEVEVKREGVDMVFLLDLSSSMNAQDVAPSRLEKASKLVVETLNQLGGDRASLVVFAANAYTIIPLTNDYAAIESYMAHISTDLVSNQGTDFFHAMSEAAKVFKNSANSSQLVVLISDGEDNEDSVNQAIKVAKDNNLFVATVGVGTTKGAPIPTYYEGIHEDYKKDQFGNTVVTKLVDGDLKKIASATQGVYFPLNSTQDALSNLMMYKTRLSKNEIAVSKMKDMNHIYQWFLAIGLVLLFIELLTSEYKIFNERKQ